MKTPAKSVTPPPANLYEKLTALATSKDVEDPLKAIRDVLLLYAAFLAKRRNESLADWSVYVERHVVGVRFILRDASGHEVDLQALPANPTAL